MSDAVRRTRPGRIGGRTPSLIDRYVLQLSTAPLLGCVAVTLVALLLERVLRLLDLLAEGGAGLGFVFELTANLVPHYLGLALPAAFFISMFVVLTRMNDQSEIDALMASGISLSRLTAPFIAIGVACALLSLLLFGYLQPYSRYAFRSVMHAAVEAGWNGRVPGQAFVSPDETLTVTADLADAAGRRLERVFVRRRDAAGGEEIFTAATALLSPMREERTLRLALRNGERVREDRNGRFDLTRFDRFTVIVPLASASALLRARGGDERELTLGELAGELVEPRTTLPPATVASELYARLARALALPLLPLLAAPLALASRRGRRGPGVIVAGVLLLLFQHSLQFSQSLAQDGRAPGAVVWLVFGVFAAICVGIFLGGKQRPGETPVSRLVDAVAAALQRLAALAPRRTAERNA